MDKKKNSLGQIVSKTQPLTRLESLRLPRNLSLNLSKPKKTFTPNLNTVRNKDKTKEILKKVTEKRKNKSTLKSHNKRDDQKDRFLQTSGVFSQGAVETKRNIPERHSYSIRESSERSSGILPKITSSTWTADKQSENLIINDLINSEHDSEEESFNSFHAINLTAPKEKLAKVEENTCNNVAEPFATTKLYSDTQSAISILKLPDSFSGRGLSVDPNVKKLFDYPLNEMLEGKIGKLLIRKSGKIEIQIGNVSYGLVLDNLHDVKEQLVSIVEKDDCCMATLGEVLNNFIMFPQFDSLLD